MTSKSKLHLLKIVILFSYNPNRYDIHIFYWTSKVSFELWKWKIDQLCLESGGQIIFEWFSIWLMFQSLCQRTGLFLCEFHLFWYCTRLHWIQFINDIFRKSLKNYNASSVLSIFNVLVWQPEPIWTWWGHFFSKGTL